MAATTFAASTHPFAPHTTARPATAALAAEGPGARAIEVAAMLGDSVIGVKHCVNPRGGKVTRATWGFVGGGLAALVASASAFASAVHTQAVNAAAVTDAIAHKIPVWSLRPEAVGTGTSLAAFGGLALAISALALGLARSRRERTQPGYRIGTAPGVEQPVEQAPSADFPLVAAHGDDFVFNFGAGIDGDLTVGGTTTPLAALVAAGHAKASRSVAGAFELAIPQAARIRARAGQTSFVVSSIAAPAAVAAPTWNPLASRTLKYVAGSLAVHLGIWAVLQQMPVEDSGGTIDLASVESTSVSTAMTALEDPAMELVQDTGEASADPSTSGASMALAAGALGKPTSQDSTGKITIAKHDDLPPAMARQAAIDAATSAGIMGSALAIETSIGSLTGEGALSVGFDETSQYNGSVEGTGNMRGAFGFGVNGTGPGGGCGFADCHGIGTGRYNTIGNGKTAGSEYGIHPGGPNQLPGHTSHVPTPHIGEPTCGSEGCGPDKALIRRYIKRNLEKVQYCYEKELLGDPSLAGTVAVQFLIAPDGTVQSASGSGMDPTVASCVAGVVKHIAFPRMAGGSVQVNYPFVFRAAGK